MADTLDLGSSAARCAGSTPAPSTLFFASEARVKGHNDWLLAAVENRAKHPARITCFSSF